MHHLLHHALGREHLDDLLRQAIVERNANALRGRGPRRPIPRRPER